MCLYIDSDASCTREALAAGAGRGEAVLETHVMSSSPWLAHVVSHIYIIYRHRNVQEIHYSIYT